MHWKFGNEVNDISFSLDKKWIATHAMNNVWFAFGNSRTQVLARAFTHDVYNFYSMNFLSYHFHTIGKYVQNYRYRLSTNKANIACK